MKKIIPIFVASLLIVACTSKTETKEVIPVDNSSSNNTIILTEQQRDSLRKLGKYRVNPLFGEENTTYYEYERVVENDSIIGIWFVEPDSNYRFEEQHIYKIIK
ncbi:MAG: hypothetical protein IJ562_04730 [Prevotella sp.]|nr:hypothetical protein [Prevotella sp.]